MFKFAARYPNAIALFTSFCGGFTLVMAEIQGDVRPLWWIIWGVSLGIVVLMTISTSALTRGWWRPRPRVRASASESRANGVGDAR
ncbi:hypothetical protein [Streptomyces sp. NPDC057939]|uniref:hypothetical protein n=1 Tax=Streptomyces sp. NPDC057939 TaxID=3346284 RepID=UPI0036E43A4F